MKVRSTTILSVRRDSQVALGGDGQVTLGQTAVKHDSTKIRRLAGGRVLCGFAGSAADAIALMERFEEKLGDSKANIRRAAIELAKAWRTDRVLRRLESMLAVADAQCSLLISGSGDVIEPTDGILAIGSGGSYAAAAAKALMENTELTAEQIVDKAINIAADLCVYTNHHVSIETLSAE